MFTTNKDEIKNIQKERDILKSFGVKVYEQFGNIDGLNSTYAIKVDDTYVFHPIKYLYALKISSIPLYKVFLIIFTKPNLVFLGNFSVIISIYDISSIYTR